MKQLLLGGLLLLSAFSNAQYKEITHPANFRGVIYDLSTNLPIEGAMIKIENQTNEFITMSDVEGYFFLIGAPNGGFKVKISMTGYEDKILDNVQRITDVEYHLGLEQKKVQHFDLN